MYRKRKSANYDKALVLDKIEERASFYSAWELKQVITRLFEGSGNQVLLKQKNPDSYHKIMDVLSDKSDPSYDEYYAKYFRELFC